MKVLFVSGGNSNSKIIPFIQSQGESLIEEGIDVEFFQIIGKGFWNYLKNGVKLKKRLQTREYDIIHAHYTRSVLVYLFAFTRVPLVLSIMGSDAYGDRNDKGKIKVSGFFDILLTQFFQFIPQVIIVKSKNIEQWVLLKKKTTIIPNGVNFNKFKPLDKIYCRNKLNLPVEKKIILFLANPNDPRKNFKLLGEAIKHITLKNTIIITPFPVNQEIIPLYLNACDVFILTSFAEGSPNVIKEAMACNCPIVSTNVGDVHEVLDGTKGCFLTKFDPIDLAINVESALSFSDRTNGRENIKHLESSIIAKRIITLYNSIC